MFYGAGNQLKRTLLQVMQFFMEIKQLTDHPVARELQPVWHNGMQKAN